MILSSGLRGYWDQAGGAYWADFFTLLTVFEELDFLALGFASLLATDFSDLVARAFRAFFGGGPASLLAARISAASLKLGSPSAEEESPLFSL